MSKRLHLENKKFGKWTVLHRATEPNAYGQYSNWKCRCECGYEQTLATGTLTAGHSRGCFSCHCRAHRGENAHNWKGGRRIDSSNGYVVLWNNGNPRREHTVIAEKALGRKLKKGEQVHHINGNKQDNRNCNLLICTLSYHRWLEHKMAYLYQKEHFS